MKEAIKQFAKQISDDIESITAVYDDNIFGGDPDRARIKQNSDARRLLIHFKKKHKEKYDELIKQIESVRY
jgi:hypothetical protein